MHVRGMGVLAHRSVHFMQNAIGEEWRCSLLYETISSLCTENTWCTRLRGTRYGLSFYVLIGTIYVNYTYTVYNVLARDILRACRARVVLVASEMVPPKGL